MKQLLIISLSILMLSRSGLVNSQTMNQMYNMKFLSQSHRVNPAFQPDNSFYLNLFEVGVAVEEPFRFDKLLNWDSQKDSFFIATPKQLIKSLNKYNFIGGDFQFGLLPSMGFRVGDKGYFTFDFGFKNYSRFSIPGDLAKLSQGIASNLNNNGDPYDFSSLVLDQTAYSELAFGYSRKVDDQLSWGVKVKMLMGIANASTNFDTFDFLATKDKWELKTDLTGNICVPNIITWGVTDEGFLDIANPEIDTSLTATDYISLVLPKNRGYGIDLGFTFRPIEKLMVSASIIDLGYINWKDNAYNVSNNSTFVFDGLNADSLFEGSDFQFLIDSLESSFTSLNTTYNAYSTSTPTKLFLGTSFDLSKKFAVGIVSRSELYKGAFREEATVALNGQLGNWFSGNLNYSLSNYSAPSWGLGFSSRFFIPPIPFFNIYLMVNNLPTSFYKNEGSSNIPYIPYKFNALSLRFGMNIVFGYHHDQKKLKDKPLLF